MATPKLVRKDYTIGGYDCAMTHLRHPVANLLRAKNMRALPGGSKMKREGMEVLARVQSGGTNILSTGLIKYSYFEQAIQAPSGAVMVAADNLYLVGNDNLVLGTDALGAALSRSVTIRADPLTLTRKLVITELFADGSTVDFSFDLGKGFDEASILSLNSLKNLIDATGAYFMGDSRVPNEPAAFLPMVIDRPIPNFAFGSTTLSHVFLVRVPNTPLGGDIFAGPYSHQSEDEFKNITFVNLNNVVYMAHKDMGLKKFDATSAYAVGMTEPTLAPVVSPGGVGVLTGAYRYIATWVHIDEQGNRIESDPTPVSADISPAGGANNVTVRTLPASSLRAVFSAIAVGAQAGVTTINVDNGGGGNHSLEPLMTVYFLDGATGTYVTRKVTARTPTTISIAGAPVNIVDNQPITNNMRIAIYRNKAGGQDFFLVAEIPNNHGFSTNTYNDNTADAALGEQFLFSALGEEHSPPPDGASAITSFQGLLILAKANRIYFSDVASPEYFPIFNQAPIYTNDNDQLTALAVQGDYLIAFKSSSCHIVSGELSSGNYRISSLSHEIGCLSPHMFQEFRSSVAFMGITGCFVIENGSPPVEISGPIRTIFTEIVSDLFMKKGTSYHDKQKNLIIWFVPMQKITGGASYATVDSRCFVWDYRLNEWYIWDNLNMMAGAITGIEDHWFVSKERNPLTNLVESRVYHGNERKDLYDFVDHHQPIPYDLETGWEITENEVQRKKFLRHRVHSLDPWTDTRDPALILPPFSLTISTYKGFDEELIHSQRSVTFSKTTRSHNMKMLSNKTRAMKYRYQNAVMYENPIISGFTSEVAMPFSAAFQE